MSGETLTVPAQFNGPQRSGNGGYASGVLAALLEQPVEVTLRSPVPLDAELAVAREADGSLRMLDGETLVAEARAVSELDLEVPEPVSVAEARRGTTRYRGLSDGEFSNCFVCGRARDDSLGVFPGEVEGRGLVATPWIPPSWTGDERGEVRPEIVWSALDCPAYFATHMEGELSQAMLARFTARIDAPAIADEEHVVVGWPIEIDGRKQHAGSAVFSADGRLLAAARALMIEPRQA